MRKLILISVLFLQVQASNLLTYNIYERDDRVDIMLSFDSPYEGQIYQKKGKNHISLSLEGVSYDALVEKTIHSPIVQSFTIDPSESLTVLSLKSNKAIGVFASKTIDGFGLRVRVKLLAPPVSTIKTSKPTQEPAQSSFELLDTKYLSVIGIMVFLLLILLWTKTKVKKYNVTAKKKSKSWLFKGGVNDIQILSQRVIDQNNRIILLDYKNTQYLVLSGASNVLLDKYSGDKSLGNKSDDGFEAVFEQNRQKLDNYLKLQQSSQLNSYKEKLAQEELFPI